MRFRLGFEYLFRRPTKVVEAFRERSCADAPEFFPGAGSDFRYDGGEEVSADFVRRFAGRSDDALGLAVFQPFLKDFLAFFRYLDDNGVEKIPFPKAFLVHKGQN